MLAWNYTGEGGRCPHIQNGRKPAARRRTMSDSRMKKEFLRFSAQVFDVLTERETLERTSVKDLVAAWCALYDKLRDPGTGRGYGAIADLLRAASDEPET